MKFGLAMIAAALLQGAMAPEEQAAETPQLEVVEIAPGVHEIPSVRVHRRALDGNTTVFDAPEGLIVIDTARHTWQSDAILSFARSRELPIAAIVNTHWHLDHSSGNIRLKEAFPNALLYTTAAVDRALGAGGFLRRNYETAQQEQSAGAGEPIEREERQLFLDTMTNDDALRPDVVLRETRQMTIAGRPLDVHVTDHAVSDADVWVYDAATRVVVLGDLVTLPAPFFETACPRKWSEELDRVWTTPFERAIPGHGAVMTRVQFAAYRSAFNAFMDCVRGPDFADQCATVWSDGIAGLEPDNTRMHDEARRYAAYYVDFLRENGGKSPDCLAE
jgi:glyoxylase-like metal-dependent hydrolase (beta-lactamase superfamily II)